MCACVGACGFKGLTLDADVDVVGLVAGFDLASGVFGFRERIEAL